MRGQSLLFLAIVGGLSLGYGCHTIAGVRSDAVLATEDGGPGSSSSGGAGGAGGMAGMAGAGGASSAGGAGGSGGGCNPADCLSNMCDQGVCAPVQAACTPSGTPFFIFIPPDFVKPDTKMVVGYSSKAAYVAIAEEDGPNPIFRVRSIDGSGKVAPVANCLISTGNANMVSVRVSDTEFVLQGHLSDAMAEISFPTNDPDGKITGPCVEQPMPSWPECVNRLESEVFVRHGNATKYATTCRDPADSNKWRIVLGGSDEPMYTDVANGTSGDTSLRIAGLGYIQNEQVLFTGPDLTGEFWYRPASKNYAATQIDFSGEPARQESVFSVLPVVDGQSVFILGGSALLPPQFDASIVAGEVSDLKQLEMVPAQGFKEIVHLTGLDVTKIGTYGNLSQDDASYYAAIVPLSKRSVEIYWFTKDGQPLLAGVPVYEVPAGDASTITRVAMVPLALQRLVVWREENAGLVTVRGQRFVCAY